MVSDWVVLFGCYCGIRVWEGDCLVVGRTLTVERRAFSEARTIRRGVRGDDFLTQPALERADHLGAHGAPLTGGGAPVAREIGPLRGLRAPLVCVSVPASVEQNTTSVELPVRDRYNKKKLTNSRHPPPTSRRPCPTRRHPRQSRERGAITRPLRLYTKHDVSPIAYTDIKINAP